AGTSPTGTVSVGSSSAPRTITNVAAGQVNATSTDAVNGSQLFTTNQNLATVTGKQTTDETNIATNTSSIS
ncbi:hypothetical protein, partial [Burkholderia gladioli]|uniref:hypothetical protein n=1 Tax=Burkholderia gladioli TaxID=28095 RepID=UPI001FC7D6A4